MAARLRIWRCTICGFTYDEAKGWPDEGIPPGTPWAEIPDDWYCPDCGAARSQFAMVEVPAARP